MLLKALFFYLFSGVTIGSAAMVVLSRNTVYSVLFLILAFFNAAGIFLLLGAEFLAMILIVVYVGAVAVLFLFVVMMLDVDTAELRQGLQQYLPVGLLIAGVLVVELFIAAAGWAFSADVLASPVAPTPDFATVSNTAALGELIYTRYVFFFQASGMILLVAMVGAIVLTLRHKQGIKRQSIAAQVNRDPATAVQLHNVPPGKGL